MRGAARIPDEDEATDADCMFTLEKAVNFAGTAVDLAVRPDAVLLQCFSGLSVADQGVGRSLCGELLHAEYVRRYGAGPDGETAVLRWPVLGATGGVRWLRRRWGIRRWPARPGR